MALIVDMVMTVRVSDILYRICRLSSEPVARSTGSMFVIWLWSIRAIFKLIAMWRLPWGLDSCWVSIHCGIETTVVVVLIALVP